MSRNEFVCKPVDVYAAEVDAKALQVAFERLPELLTSIDEAERLGAERGDLRLVSFGGEWGVTVDKDAIDIDDDAVEAENADIAPMMLMN